MNKIFSAVLLGSALSIFQISHIYSFDVPSHRAFSEKAVRSSNLDGFLRSELNIAGGIDQFFDGRRVFEWVQEGSEREDDSGRFCNHFHNPLLDWNQAGLQIAPNPVCPTTNTSSVLWGQRPDLQSSNESEQFAWQNARQRYFDGLTASTQTVRDQKLGLTFRTLGQVIHLVQDAAVPAHTRNDAHPTFIDPDGLEGYVESILGTSIFNQLTSVITRYNSSILALSSNSLAPIPIAKIIDTDQPSAIPSAGTDVGMAEYSDGNLVSDDTIFTSGFVYPRVASLGPSFKFKGVTYFPKVADGELVDHFVAQAKKGAYLLNDSNSLIFQDYSAKLLPRAIGYSAGLIDYFFRGRLKVVLSSNQPMGNSITQLPVKVANITDSEESGMGQITAVALSGNSVLAVSPQKEISLGRVEQAITFDFSLTPIPWDTPNLFFILAYRGPLGLEQDSVMVGGRSFINDSFDRNNSAIVRAPTKPWTEVEINPTMTPTAFRVVSNILAAVYSINEIEANRVHGYMYWDPTNNDKFSADQGSEALSIQPTTANASGFAGLAVRIPVGINNPDSFTGICVIYEGDYFLVPNAGGPGLHGERTDHFLRIYAVVNGALRPGGNSVTALDTQTGFLTRSFAPGWNNLYEEFLGSFGFQAVGDPNKFKNKVHTLQVVGDSITLRIIDALGAGNDKVITVTSSLVSGGQPGDTAPGFVSGINVDDPIGQEIDLYAPGIGGGSQGGSSNWDNWVGNSL